ncbi:hypothetical protein V6O07_18880, partial [Arthrospira platensis SPKY2]
METQNKTENALNELVKRALEVAEKTGEFVIEQAPHLSREFYAWHTYSSIFWMVVSLVVVFLLYSKVQKSLHKLLAGGKDHLDVFCFMYGGATISVF